MSWVDQIKCPFVCVDIIIEAAGGKIVLIRRKNPPAGWALPGGFVERGETLEAAALREAMEETSLRITLLEQFRTYSDPKRDPRFHTVSTVYLARAEGTPCGADDAAEARLFGEGELPADVCFDHGKILGDYFAYRKTGKFPRLT